MSVTVGGNGIFVEIVKGIVDAMTPATSSYKIDVTPCLPSPSVPNTDRYAQIGKVISDSIVILGSFQPINCFSFVHYNVLDFTNIRTVRTEVITIGFVQRLFV